jgi:RNA polymerase sigma-70 factor (sigma-E family)
MAPTGDEAFTAFVAAAEPRLLRAAWLLTGDGHRAEELVQDTLVRTYAVWNRVSGTDPYAYARRTLVNARTDSWRRRRKEQLTGALPEPLGPDHADVVVARSEVTAALQRLRPRERQVVVLRYYLDRSEAETADELGVSLGTVKSTASRALARLRESETTPDQAGAAR